MIVSVKALGEWCNSAITRIKQGPAEFNLIIDKNQVYEDESFNGRDTLYWFGYDSIGKFFTYEYGLFLGTYGFQRLGDVYPDATMFGNNPEWHDIMQGEAGTCYIEASLASVAEFPDVTKAIFVT